MIALPVAVAKNYYFVALLKTLIQQTTKPTLGCNNNRIYFQSAIHMQFLGSYLRFMLGVFLGYLLVWTGSIWAPILAHFINNGSAVLLSYYEQKIQ